MAKVLIDRELLERAVKADASIGASSIALVDGWKAMAQIRAILAQPAQQSEEVEVVAWRTNRDEDGTFPRLHKTEQEAKRWVDVCNVAPAVTYEPLMTVAQHQRILAASVPANCKVVPVDLIERTICRLTHGHEHDKAVRELRTLLTGTEGSLPGAAP